MGLSTGNNAFISETNELDLIVSEVTTGRPSPPVRPVVCISEVSLEVLSVMIRKVSQRQLFGVWLLLLSLINFLPANNVNPRITLTHATERVVFLHTNIFF